jgi:hypothetical protein
MMPVQPKRKRATPKSKKLPPIVAAWLTHGRGADQYAETNRDRIQLWVLNSGFPSPSPNFWTRGKLIDAGYGDQVRSLEAAGTIMRDRNAEDDDAA